MNESNKILKIARSLMQVIDQDNKNINIFADPYRKNYPIYIIFNLQNDKYKVIKTKKLEQFQKLTNKQNKDYSELCFDLIYNSTKYEKELFDYIKILTFEQLKNELINGQFKLDIKTFKETYGGNFKSYQFKDFEFYIENNFKQEQIQCFLNKIYSIIDNKILKKLGCTIQFRSQIEQNRIAQYDIVNDLIQIKQLNVHAFLHQLGHKYFYQNNPIILKISKQLYNKQKFPSNLSKQNTDQFFAELFAFFFQNKNINNQQKNFINQYVLNKRIGSAKIKLYKLIAGTDQNIKLYEHNYIYLKKLIKI